MSEESFPDPVTAAFENMRKQALKRNGSVPDLNKQIPRRKMNSSAEASKPRQRGIPTGRDGRRLPKKDNISAFGDVLGFEIKRRGWERSLAGGWVHAHWAELVGERIAAHTKIEMIKDKKIFISCDSTAWATNLRLMQKDILQKIAAQVGPDIIAELRIFGPKAPSWRHGPLHVKGRGPRDTYG